MAKVSKASLTSRILYGVLIAIMMVGIVLLTAFDGQAPIGRTGVSLMLSVLIIGAIIEMRRAFSHKISDKFSWIIWAYAFFFGTVYIFLGFTGVLLFTLVAFGCAAITAMVLNKLDELIHLAFVLVYPGMFMASLLYINRCASTMVIDSTAQVFPYLSNDVWAYISSSRNTQLLPYNTIGLGLVFAVSAFTDVFAFIFGVLFGKHKLMPSVSPKKTVEGAIGGLFGGLVGSGMIYVLFECFQLFGIQKSLSIQGLSTFNLFLTYVVIGLIGSVMTQLGDLMASLVKRSCDIKDYSDILGAHGGIMDRFDGIMFNSVFVALVFVFII